MEKSTNDEHHVKMWYEITCVDFLPGIDRVLNLMRRLELRSVRLVIFKRQHFPIVCKLGHQ